MKASLRFHPMTRVLVGVVPVAFFVSGCHGSVSRCKPTVTRARDAAVVDVTDVNESAVLSARLTAAGKPLRSQVMKFALHRRGAYAVDWFPMYYEERVIGTGLTDANGVARYDLKDEELDDFLHDVWAEEYTAIFDGTKTYCGSSDKAKLSLVKTPVADVDYREGRIPPVAVTPTPVAAPGMPVDVRVPAPRRVCKTALRTRLCVPLPSADGLDPHLP